MASHIDREHYIPIRVSELIDFLCDGKGTKGEARLLPADEAKSFRELAHAVVQHHHLHFNTDLQRLKVAYAPFDPDIETVTLVDLDPTLRNERVSQLFDEIDTLVKTANFSRLTRSEMEKVIAGASYWGLEMDVSWEVFERIEAYYRGDSMGKRTRRRWWKLWKREELEVAEFNRLIIVLKQKEHKRLGPDADTNDIFIKLFKDMPKVDLEMVLPGTRVRLSKIDKGLIVYPLLMGLGLLIYSILTNVFNVENFLAKFLGSIALTWSLAIGFAGYAYRSYYTYTVKKTAYSLQLTESLYYQSLDSNAGVFYRLIDEAEEQETREVLLAYFYLWKLTPTGGSTAKELDAAIEKDFESRLSIKFDFEILDAIHKLERFGLVEKIGDNFKATQIDRALSRMREHTRTTYEGSIAAIPSSPSRPLSSEEREQRLLEKLELETS